MIVGIIDDGDHYPKCYECWKCELPIRDNKCGKFGKKIRAIKDTNEVKRDEKDGTLGIYAEAKPSI